MKNLAIALLFLLCTCMAFAASDGNQLLHDCQVSIHAEDTGTLLEREEIPATYCVAVVHGVSDLAQVWGGVEYPLGWTEAQGIRVVVAYLERHPESLHKRDTLLIYTALREAFPKK